MISEKNRLFVGDEERRGKRGERSVARKGVFVRSTRLTPMGWRLGSIEKQKLVVSPEPRRFGVVPLRRRAARRVGRGVGGTRRTTRANPNKRRNRLNE